MNLLAALIFSGLICIVLAVKIAFQWRELNKLDAENDAIIGEIEYWKDRYELSNSENTRMTRELDKCWHFINTRTKKLRNQPRADNGRWIKK